MHARLRVPGWLCPGGLVAATLLLFTACRTLPPAAIPGPGADAPWPQQRAALAKLERYSLAGRVAVAANGQGFTAALHYAQARDIADLALDGPFGIGGLRVHVAGDELGVQTSRGESLDGAAARAELERRLGFPLPTNELRWWLLGVPAPGASDTLDETADGEIRGFAQSGWRVSIQARAAGLGFSLPQKLTAERAGARMKLVVDHWQP